VKYVFFFLLFLPPKQVFFHDKIGQGDGIDFVKNCVVTVLNITTNFTQKQDFLKRFLLLK
jgi:hypothetical protein